MKNLEISLDNGRHALLGLLCGKWKGTIKTWFEPDVLADESIIQGEIKPILGGRFVEHIYMAISKETGKQVEGRAVWGYDLTMQIFQCSWIDEFHTGTNIMFSESEQIPDCIDAVGVYLGGDEVWRWRTRMVQPEIDRLIITMYNITPFGEEAKAVEVVYKRM